MKKKLGTIKEVVGNFEHLLNKGESLVMEMSTRDLYIESRKYNGRGGCEVRYRPMIDYAEDPWDDAYYQAL